MTFKEFILNNAQKDSENNTYTRYIMEYNEKLDMPILVALTTTPRSDVIINIYKTDLPGCYNLKVNKENYEDEICGNVINGVDFDVEEKPISTLDCSCMGNYATIGFIHTQEKYSKNGLGTYAVQLVQDYYKKTNRITNDNGERILYASKWAFSNDIVYENRFERKLGNFGKLLAHTKAKIRGRNSEMAYMSFLAKNNFEIQDHPYHVPSKRIVRNRNMISERLLDEYTKKPVIQCFEYIVGLDGMVYEQ